MNSHTLLLRQVHPNFIAEGQVSSQAFVPFPKDENKLSLYDGDQISASDSYLHYTEQLRFQSAGVWAVTCEEAAQLNLPSKPDPLEDFPQHALIDFTSHPATSHRKLAKRLREFAVARGCLHAPK